MQCPKCGRENPDGAAFCTQCHATLVFKCPKCWHEQNHGGKCDHCGADFAQLQGVYFGKVVAEEMNDTQNEVNRANAAANAVTNPVLTVVTILVRWIYTLFFA